MILNDPRYPDGWDTSDEAPVVRLSTLQLLARVHHHVRQKAAVCAGLGQLLADGGFGFASQEQHAAINQLQTNIAAIEQAQQWMEEWMVARVDHDGNWISDEHGNLPPRDGNGR
jgi:hypothetical protein